MKRNSTLSILILSLAIFFYSQSNAQLKMDAQLRNRCELRNGYQALAKQGSVPAFLISQRTRISFRYLSENLKLTVTPQDVRIWGDEQLASSTGVYGDDASLSLFEGYAELKLPKNFWISVGRQQLVYDNQRLLAARNWNQNGLAYDAIVVKYSPEEWNIHLGSSWNSLKESSSDNFYSINRIKSLNFLWINRQFSKELMFSFLHMASGVTESDTTNTLFFRQTSGLYSVYTNHNFKIQADAFYQYGKSLIGKTVSAFLFDADISYTTAKFKTGIGAGYLSGNSKAGSELDTDHLFDILYGARHSFFGGLDYFRNIPSNTKQGGLTDYYFYLNFKLSKQFNITNTSHYFQLAQTNPLTPLNKNIGYENDLIFKYTCNSWCYMEGGFLFMIPTKTLETIQETNNPEFSHFLYLQLTIIPSLLKTF